jgi:L-lactate dehydrogenase (cytochrome)
MRDVHNGLTVPPELTPSTAAEASLHPAWWFNLLSTEPLSFASLSRWSGTVSELANAMFDPSVTFADIAWIRAAWPGPLVIKGIQTADDARRAAEAGADAIVVSTHGGRQLDRAPTPLETLPEVAEAVGDRVDVLADTGILHGGDIVAALALGAKACLVGRAYLYGLMAGGQRGVAAAISILTDEITRTLQLLGVADLEHLERSHVRLRIG